jgi:hypothetical protein
MASLHGQDGGICFACTGADANATVGPGAPAQAPGGTPVVPTPPSPSGFFSRLGNDIRQAYQGVRSLSITCHALLRDMHTGPVMSASQCPELNMMSLPGCPSAAASYVRSFMKESSHSGCRRQFVARGRLCT